MMILKFGLFCSSLILSNILTVEMCAKKKEECDPNCDGGCKVRGEGHCDAACDRGYKLDDNYFCVDAPLNCFAGSSTVVTRGGKQILMSDLVVGDEVLTAAESTDGDTTELTYAPVIAFLDRDVEKSAEFVEIVTTTAHKLTVTPSHLIYVADNSSTAPRMIFSAYAKVGYFVFAVGDEKAANTATRDEIASIRVVQLSEGVYAPLTTAGTIMVDGITCSCYAEFGSHRMVHAAMLPMRLYHYVKSALVGSISYAERSGGSGALAECDVDRGIHWYAGLLRGVADNLSLL